MKIDNPFSVSCREATYLISIKEEGKLSAYQSFRLFTHMIWCKMCQAFVKQNQYIINQANKINADAVLSPDFKLQLANRINDELNNNA